MGFGMLRLNRHRRLCNNRAIKAGLAVDVLGGHQWTFDRPVTTGINLHIATIADFANDPRVAGRQRQRHIARHRGDTKEVDIVGTAKSQHNGASVILARIGVDDDGSGRVHGHGVQNKDAFTAGIRSGGF